MTNKPVNLQGISVMDDSLTSMTFPKAANLRYEVVVPDKWASDKTTTKNDGKDDGKEKDERK